eukprot:28875-Prymnesium_polylepis.1
MESAVTLARFSRGPKADFLSPFPNLCGGRLLLSFPSGFPLSVVARSNRPKEQRATCRDEGDVTWRKRRWVRKYRFYVRVNYRRRNATLTSP